MEGEHPKGVANYIGANCPGTVPDFELLSLVPHGRCCLKLDTG